MTQWFQDPANLPSSARAGSVRRQSDDFFEDHVDHDDVVDFEQPVLHSQEILLHEHSRLAGVGALPASKAGSSPSALSQSDCDKAPP
eukprot:CAMPEP_0173388148 /NCGR_PEP_ID=MMETSP1356-20130122/10530_1 /TAXON_ID=77927 ORGANISM="Hemiselmis virescens, Strain PCC157" /NCGR_SAMPLE_ID=MMETSP1356 /ASSEMBLY_ACC=CAM_ASM_000847 /LENGTH=86 /DNA_ID=CAMNT_0014344979 /DNA_START=146 /DNA_END=402 /DNA_ORIENTATION=-